MRESQAAYGVARRRQSTPAGRCPYFAALAVWALVPFLQLANAPVTYADQIMVNDAALDELRPGGSEVAGPETERDLLAPPSSALESRFYLPGRRDVPEEAKSGTRTGKPTPKFLGLAGPRLGDDRPEEITKQAVSASQATGRDAEPAENKAKARFFGPDDQKAPAKQEQKTAEKVTAGKDGSAKQAKKAQQSNETAVKTGSAPASATAEAALQDTRASDLLSSEPVKIPEAPKELLETRVPEYLLRDDIARKAPPPGDVPESEAAKPSEESAAEVPDEKAQEPELAAPSEAPAVPPPAPDTVETPSEVAGVAATVNRGGEAVEPDTKKTQTAARPAAQSPFETVSLSFQPSGSELGDEAKNHLKEVAAKLTENPGLRIQVIAYGGDASTSAADARRLALTRAAAVRAYLESLGVSQRRVDLRPLGVAPAGEPHRVEIKAAAS